jgi:hypothetical protein
VLSERDIPPTDMLCDDGWRPCASVRVCARLRAPANSVVDWYQRREIIRTSYARILHMPFYYLLHQVLPDTPPRFTEGKRNCMTFMIGSFLYLVVYVIVKNSLKFGVCMDPVLHALFPMWVADCSTMAYIYRNHYGRNIMHEMSTEGEDERSWVYDEATHRYRRPTERDAAAARKLEGKQRAAEEKKERVEAVTENKRRIRAAKVIQRSWRKKIYAPPNGVMFLRAKESFNTDTSSSPTDAKVSDKGG